MYLSVATLDDVKDILDCARDFHEESVYSDQVFEPAKAVELIENLIWDPHAIIICMNQNGKIIGVIGGLITEGVFNSHKNATELMWWVHPEKRKGTTGIRLLNAFETWAFDKKGCQTVTMVSLADSGVDKIYHKRGYREKETSWQIDKDEQWPH